LSAESAHTAQAATAGMRSQVAALFEQLDARGMECQEMLAQQAAHQHEVAELESVAAEAQQLFAELAMHGTSSSAQPGSPDMSELALHFASNPGSVGAAAWQHLESMLENDHRTPDADQLQRSKDALLSVLPRVAKLTAQVDELRESRDSLAREHQQHLTEHEREVSGLQFMRSFNESELEVTKVELSEEKERCFSLELRVTQGFEELRRASSEMESLEHIAELHKQNSLKVHRLMCEDAQTRLHANKRGISSNGQPASPQRAPTRRSTNLRTWQASLEDQSQALLERSWTLLNNSGPIAPGFVPLDDMLENEGTDRPHALLHSDNDESLPAGGHLLDASLEFYFRSKSISSAMKIELSIFSAPGGSSLQS